MRRTQSYWTPTQNNIYEHEKIEHQYNTSCDSEFIGESTYNLHIITVVNITHAYCDQDSDLRGKAIQLSSSG